MVKLKHGLYVKASLFMLLLLYSILRALTQVANGSDIPIVVMLNLIFSSICIYTTFQEIKDAKDGEYMPIPILVGMLIFIALLVLNLFSILKLGG